MSVGASLLKFCTFPVALNKHLTIKTLQAVHVLATVFTYYVDLSTVVRLRETETEREREGDKNEHMYTCRCLNKCL